jgi:hypothetical protein
MIYQLPPVTGVAFQHPPVKKPPHHPTTHLIIGASVPATGAPARMLNHSGEFIKIRP